MEGTARATALEHRQALSVFREPVGLGQREGRGQESRDGPSPSEQRTEEACGSCVESILWGAKGCTQETSEEAAHNLGEK